MKLSPAAPPRQPNEASRETPGIAEFFRTVESPYQRPGDLLEDRDAGPASLLPA